MWHMEDMQFACLIYEFETYLVPWLYDEVSYEDNDSYVSLAGGSV